MRSAGLAVVRRPRHVRLSGRVHFAYARATSLLLHVLAWACLAQSVYFIMKGVVSRSMERAGLLMQVAAAAALTVAPVLVVHNCPHSEACSSAYQALTGTMMDDGAGG